MALVGRTIAQTDSMYLSCFTWSYVAKVYDRLQYALENIVIACLKLVRTLLNVYFTAFKSSFLSLSMHI